MGGTCLKVQPKKGFRLSVAQAQLVVLGERVTMACKKVPLEGAPEELLEDGLRVAKKERR